MRILITLLVSYLLLACNDESTSDPSTKKGNSEENHIEHKQILAKVNYDDLLKVIHKNDDKLYVVNFWATWCVPCVEELPHFMEVNEEFASNKDYQMLLVSLDKSDQLDTGVKSFIDKNSIPVDCYLLDDVKRMNYWIEDIDSSWTGAIPITVLYKNGEKLYFKEGQLSKSELESVISKNL